MEKLETEVNRIFQFYENRGRNWFFMTYGEKINILSDLRHSYISYKIDRGVTDSMTLLQHLSEDIEKVKQQERLELEDMLSHIWEMSVEAIENIMVKN
jgi:hypothetical protein